MRRSSVSEPWLLCPKPNPQADLRLFCFPHAGGGASLFNKWFIDLPRSVELICVQPPGRETRIFECPYTEIDSLVEALTPVIARFTDKRFAFFGHSMGALISFELCRAFRDRGVLLPISLFVSGRQAPHLPDNDPPCHHLPDDAFLHELHELNGTSLEVLENAELMEIYLPGIRADFELCETYAYRPEPPLQVPIVAFGGIDDPDVSADEIAAWRDHTTESFRSMMLPGHHFFLESARPQLLRLLSQELIRLSSANVR